MAAYGYELAGALRAGKTVLTAWSAQPEAGLVGMIAGAGFDAVTMDMQHGGHHEASIWDGVAAVLLRRVPAIVRVPVGRFDMASRALDFGADAVIAPMINSVEDARALAAFTKYPPLGERSWGPTRGLALRGVEGGNAYLHSANADTLCFAMIETRAALDALDDILDVDGIDAVFVGPADFSIAWTGGQGVDATLDDMMDAVADVAARAKAKGKLAGIFAVDPAMAPRYAQMGFGLIAAGFDAAIVNRGAQAVLSAARGG
ncbi:HpcH/HpaI aldolase family protein [Roseitalea porphyridii]|uniref:2,4-dihydroxyhept-2-ene-1,7-dioic acid aldolase n=1 Tax=Roseitalea porphyridii TaxID=1852022 RepID=A0A4P6V2P4_9HYPH|nr:aldolase/citrate lyase family protein [Roseitalea porphyridii]QBK30959.1 2,4-dihydroxyhept-2-ene-1,7-dioic acid aldolase [Roseitalea porphyridii]